MIWAVAFALWITLTAGLYLALSRDVLRCVVGLALLGLGLVMITSASSEVAAVQSGNPLYHMFRHLVYVALGLGAGAMTMMVPIATWQRMGFMMLICAFGLLVMVPVTWYSSYLAYRDIFLYDEV